MELALATLVWRRVAGALVVLEYYTSRLNVIHALGINECSSALIFRFMILIKHTLYIFFSLRFSLKR